MPRHQAIDLIAMKVPRSWVRYKPEVISVAISGARLSNCSNTSSKPASCSDCSRYSRLIQNERVLSQEDQRAFSRSLNDSSFANSEYQRPLRPSFSVNGERLNLMLSASVEKWVCMISSLRVARDST